ncbi:MAG: efflux RND transporter periplasmic adaptor subunit [Gemmatimonadota bacterium]
MERVAVVLSLALALGLPGCSRSDASVGGDGASDELAVVERGDLEIRVEAAGQLEPILMVEVKSKASGEVKELHVETGDQVDRGDLLAEVDPRDVRNALAQARADLDVAEARVQVSESQARRAQELMDANVVTQQELEQSALELANGRAALTRAETNLELAQERMGDVTIRAPITGTIIQKSVEAGQIIASASGNVSGGTTLMLMADLSSMQVRTLVDETDIGKVEPGQAAKVQVEAYPDQSFVGSVYKIEPQAVVDQNVTMFPVLVRLDNRQGLLKPNMNAEVQVDVARADDVVLVPNAAVVSLQDAAAAGAVLGLSQEAVRNGMSRTPAPAARDTGVSDGSSATGGSEAAQAQDGEVDCQALLQKARSDRSSLTEEERGQMRACFQGMGGGMGARAGMGAGGMRGGGDPDTRPAVVFVQTPDGPEARRVVLGLNDWDRTQVVSGLEAGERVILVSVARLRQQQEDMMNRIRERSSPIPGGGGGGRGR